MSKVLAYQTGVTYPGFTDVDRESLARVFALYDFSRSARRLREFDRHRALAATAAGIGTQRRDGLRVSALVGRDGSHIASFQVERLVQHGRERAESVPGARVYSTKEGIFTSGPAHGQDLADCRAFADELRQKAERLVTHANTGAVSRAVSYMIEESRAFRFITKGSYILLAGEPTADRVIGALRAIRKEFYDPAARTGLRASVVEILDNEENRSAVTDAVLDDAERTVLAVIEQLIADSRDAPARNMTFEKHCEDARKVLGGLKAARHVPAKEIARLEKLVQGVVDSYTLAKSPSELSVPDWLTEASRALGGNDP